MISSLRTRVVSWPVPKSTKTMLIVGAFCCYALVLMAFYNWSNLAGTEPGLRICDSDCSGFDRWSDYIVENRSFYPFTPDPHSSVFYRGYTLSVAIMKGVFGNSWKIVYVLLNGVMTAGLALLAAKQFNRGRDYTFTFLAIIGLFSVNLQLLVFGKMLLADYMFAVGASYTFVLLAVGVARNDRTLLVSAGVVAVLTAFVRPSRVALVALTVGTILFSSISTRWRFHLAVAAPLMAGVGAAILTAGMTAYGVNNLNDYPTNDIRSVETIPAKMRVYMRELLRFNYLGENNVLEENRLGATIVHDPYLEWSMNDGSLVSIMGSFIKRAPRVFQIAMPDFSTAHNAYRYLYYGAINAAFVIFVIHAVRVRKRQPEFVILIALLVGYLIISVAITHVELRFRLPFDFLIAICAAFVFARGTKRILSRLSAG